MNSNSVFIRWFFPKIQFIQVKISIIGSHIFNMFYSSPREWRNIYVSFVNKFVFYFHGSFDKIELIQFDWYNPLPALSKMFDCVCVRACVRAIACVCLRVYLFINRIEKLNSNFSYRLLLATRIHNLGKSMNLRFPEFRYFFKYFIKCIVLGDGGVAVKC